MLSACATESVNLNSERIEKRYGSCGVEVLTSEAGLRRSSLFSFDGDTSTCRTYAVVQFVEQLDERYNDAHSRVLAEDSIGATFRFAGAAGASLPTSELALLSDLLFGAENAN